MMDDMVMMAPTLRSNRLQRRLGAIASDTSVAAIVCCAIATMEFVLPNLPLEHTAKNRYTSSGTQKTLIAFPIADLLFDCI